MPDSYTVRDMVRYLLSAKNFSYSTDRPLGELEPREEIAWDPGTEEDPNPPLPDWAGDLHYGYAKSAPDARLAPAHFLLPEGAPHADPDEPIEDTTATNLLVLDGTIANLRGRDTLREAGIGMNTKIL